VYSESKNLIEQHLVMQNSMIVSNIPGLALIGNTGQGGCGYGCNVSRQLARDKIAM
jgi:hypothetical protein